MSLVDEDGRTEYDAAREAGERIAALQQQVQRHEPGGVPYLLVQDGYSIETAEGLLARPLRIRARPVFLKTSSFVEYVNRFKSEDTLLFADQQAGAFRAELDYHGPQAAAHRDHHAALMLKASEEWNAWLGANKRWFGQVELAEYLEEREADIQEPDSATLLEAIKKLKLAKAVQFTSAIDLTNGGLELAYTEKVTETGKLRLPTQFVVALRPFEHCEPVGVRLKLRYRLDDGRIKFQYLLPRPELIAEAAFKLVAEEVEAQTGLTPLYGGVK